MDSGINHARYADTGFAVKDTAPEFNERLFAAMMRGGKRNGSSPLVRDDKQ